MVATATVVFGTSGFSWAKAVRTKVHATLRSATKPAPKAIVARVVRPLPLPEALAEPATMPNQLEPQAVPDDAKNYRLRLDNMHTGEKIDIVYRVGNTYVPEALAKLNAFLRDHYTEDVVDYDPKEFDVLNAMMERLGRTGEGVIDVVCGYRTPATNAELRQNSPRTGVAEHSQHMEGHAIDLRVPGVSTATLRNAALSLHAGGVGYYPTSGFVHVDVGPVRQWVFGRSPAKPAAHRTTHTNAGM